MILLDGKATAAKRRALLAEKTRLLIEKTGVRPGIAVIRVGEDPASQVYVRNKEKAASEAGFYSRVIILPEAISQKDLLLQVRRLNDDPAVHGILVQLPLPAHLDATEVIESIAPQKDVDAFSYISVGKICVGKFDFLPCTPAGILALLEEYGIDPEGKRAVVIGRSNIVGKPMALLLLHRNATVTICHSKTPNLAAICREADILVSAVGKAGFVNRDMVKPGAVVVDVGMNRKDGVLCGDVLFDEVSEIASYITPVPGGVGPMTVTMLLENTYTAARLAAEKTGANV